MGRVIMDSTFYKKMLNYVDEGIYFVDNDRRITFWNKGAELITGFSSEEVLDSYCYHNILNHTDEYGNKLCHNGCPLHKTMEDGELRSTKVYLHHKEGYRIPINIQSIPIYDGDRIVGAVEIFSDKSNKLEMYKHMEKLKRLAMFDQLTGIPNRRFIEGMLESKIIEHINTGISFGILFIDIDHFKKVNDKYGHDIGDEVLKIVAKTLNSSRTDGDYVARWGGEEFVALICNCDIDELYKKADLLRILVEDSSLRYTDEEISVTVSIGGKIIESGMDIDQVVKKADEAMYKSKEDGRNRVTIYDLSLGGKNGTVV
jgi:diguanylate cyclase (GGDEF)-like protein/PAS domain S-box-containing protein